MTSPGHSVSPGQGHRTARNAEPMHASRLRRWERRTEGPLAVASLLFLTSYAVRVLGDGLPDALRDLSLAVTCAAWAVFAVDYAVRWRMTGVGLRFVTSHLLDTAVLLLPLLRPLRVVRVYEAVQRRRQQPRLGLYARVMVYAGLSTGMLGFAASLALYQQEHAAPGTTVGTFGDAVWCVCATMATVGYGDVSPVTALGRLILVGVMACGLVLIGAITGSFASWLLQVFAREGADGPRSRETGESD